MIGSTSTTARASRSWAQVGLAVRVGWCAGLIACMLTVGEPINPEVWRWYRDVIGEGRSYIADTWWQTELGGITISPSPLETNHKPGYAMRPAFGTQPCLLDAVTGVELEGDGKEGLLAIKGATPAMARTIYGDHERFVATYFKEYPGYYVTGDGAIRDEDGHYRVTGRLDDVINVSGHRMGTAEVGVGN